MPATGGSRVGEEIVRGCSCFLAAATLVTIVILENAFLVYSCAAREKQSKKKLVAQRAQSSGRDDNKVSSDRRCRR